MPGSVLRLILLVWAVLLLAACSSGARKNREVCNEPQEYQAARSVPPLKIPEGLDEPDRSERLVIPGKADPNPYPNGRPCLERPPDYFGRDDQATDQH
ncbi:MAG TPA: hypothetical protein ENK16_00535 [Chromatiales bacterium]|nr:hypothetical protein [Chromatiales bacterium]